MGVDSYNMYYQQYCELLQQLASGEGSTELFKQLEETLQQMMVEARDVDDSEIKHELIQRTHQYKENIRLIQETKNRDDLLRNSSTRVSTGRAPNERLRQNEDALARQNETLQNAMRSMQETEEVGREISTELGRNRETIESSQARVQELSGMTQKADKILKNMNQWWNR